MCLFYLYVRTYVPVVLAGRALPVCACSLCCGYVRTYGDAPTMMILCLVLLWMMMLLVVMMPTLTAMLLQTVVATMLTTLVPTTVLRAARTTMCFAARHATLHETSGAPG